MKNSKIKKYMASLLIICGLFFAGFFANVFFKKVVRANELIVVIDSGQMFYTEFDDSIFGLQYEIVRTFADSTKMILE
ncbi:MAG: hypothetical protein LBB41_02685, partial [Prevotellaceae bacterium]|nr:hypothetical protein [Prevotellaceae bacterium]